MPTAHARIILTNQAVNMSSLQENIWALHASPRNDQQAAQSQWLLDSSGVPQPPCLLHCCTGPPNRAFEFCSVLSAQAGIAATPLLLPRNGAALPTAHRCWPPPAAVAPTGLLAAKLGAAAALPQAASARTRAWRGRSRPGCLPAGRAEPLASGWTLAPVRCCPNNAVKLRAPSAGRPVPWRWWQQRLSGRLPWGLWG